MFKRKALKKLKYWKEKKASKYSVLLEGTAILDREEFRCPQNTSNRDTIIWTQFRAGSGIQPLFGLPKVSYWKRYHSALSFDDAFNSLR